MGEAANTETLNSPNKQNRKRKQKPQPEQNEEENVEQPVVTKLRKPQAPTKKSRKKLKQEERKIKEKQEVLEKYKSSIVTYLNTWKNDKSSWKFSKNTQNWILSNLYDSDLIPDSVWPTVLEYFGGSKGAVKTNITESATKIIEGAEDETNEVILCRAKDIIQSIIE